MYLLDDTGRVRRVVGWGLVALLLASLAPPWGVVSAAEPLSGPIYLAETLLVGPGETLVVAPGTTITGPGRIDVAGTLTVDGSAQRRVEIGVPIALRGTGPHTIRDARLWGVNETALTLHAGSLTLERVSFEGNGVGLAVQGNDSRLRGSDLLFRAHVDDAMRIQGPADVALARAALQDNARGLAVELGLAGGTLRVNASDFQRNGEHLTVELGSGRVDLADNDIGPVALTSGARLPSITARTGAAGGLGGVLALERNRVHDGDVGLRIEGGGFHVTSTNDTFERNRVGLHVTSANVVLRGTRIDSGERDVESDASSILSMSDVVLGSEVVPAPIDAPRGPSAAWLAPLALGFVVVLGGGAMVLTRRRRRAAAPAAPAAPPAPPPIPIDLRVPLKPLEARILRDVVQHPGSAQSAVAQRLGLSRQALHYHVKKLEARGLLTKVPQGRETRCFVPDAVVPQLPAPEAPAQDGALPPEVTHADRVEKG